MLKQWAYKVIRAQYFYFLYIKQMMSTIVEEKKTTWFLPELLLPQGTREPMGRSSDYKFLMPLLFVGTKLVF